MRHMGRFWPRYHQAQKDGWFATVEEKHWGFYLFFLSVPNIAVCLFARRIQFRKFGSWGVMKSCFQILHCLWSQKYHKSDGNRDRMIWKGLVCVLSLGQKHSFAWKFEFRHLKIDFAPVIPPLSLLTSSRSATSCVTDMLSTKTTLPTACYRDQENICRNKCFTVLSLSGNCFTNTLIFGSGSFWGQRALFLSRSFFNLPFHIFDTSAAVVQWLWQCFLAGPLLFESSVENPIPLRPVRW